MSEPQPRYVTCSHPGGLHRMAYWQWGEPDNPSVIVCCHGLTRSGREFTPLAQSLATHHRVVCPDMIGRGRSDWVADPQWYAVPQYVADCVTLVARLDVERLAWVGTSMGGLIGMALAALDGTPIARLVLNDIGPDVDRAGVARIADVVGTDPSFASFEEGAARVRELAAEFGPHTDAQWDVLTRYYVVQRDGAWRFHYDPRIREPFRTAPAPDSRVLWALYDRIRCPTLVIRGEHSDLLSDATAQRMTERGPRARRVDVAGVGHAPTLVPDAQVGIVEQFLSNPWLA
jgi:pimeloyl-ACP methyl ester carboxylesterase